LDNAAGDSGFYRAQGHIQFSANFLIRFILEIEQNQGSAVNTIDLFEGVQHLGRVRAFNFGGDVGQFRIDFVELKMGKAGLFAADLEESAVQGSEHPGFDLGIIAQLAAFGREGIKGVLGEVPGIGLTAGEREGELKKAWLMEGDQIFEARKS
jgi:hypothetical protein